VLGVKYQGGGCGRGGQMRQDAKGPGQMRLDAHCPSGRIGRGPFTSQQNEPGQTNPEQEFTL